MKRPCRHAFAMAQSTAAPKPLSPRSHPTQMISFYGIFAAGFATRPLGALIFGWISDRYSRKTALMLSIVLMSIPTALVGCLPTYQTVGAAVSLLTCIIILPCACSDPVGTVIPCSLKRVHPGGPEALAVGHVRHRAYCCYPADSLQAGIAAPLLLAAIRVLQGFAVGGEFTSTMVRRGEGVWAWGRGRPQG